MSDKKWGLDMLSKRQLFIRTGLIIWAVSLIGAVAVLPYTLALSPDAFAIAAEQASLSETLLLGISVLQSAAILGVMTFVGLWAANKIDLQVPVVSAWLQGQPAPAGTRRSALQAIGLGAIAAFLIVLLDATVFGLDIAPGDTPDTTVWQRALATLYGGITEEVQLRLFLLSLLALSGQWILNKFSGKSLAELSCTPFWIANLLAAIAFGLGHLPATAQLVELTPMVISRALVLNSIVGLLAGYLYYRRGFEMAMLAHFAADIVLLLIVAG